MHRHLQFVKQIVTPSVEQIIVCTSLAVVVLLVSLRQWLLSQIATTAKLSPKEFIGYYNNYLSGVNGFSHSTIWRTIAIVLVLIGLIIFLVDVIKSARHNVDNQTRLLSIRFITSNLLKVVMLLVLVALVIITLRYSLPLWLNLADQAVLGAFGPLTIIALALALIGSVINYYALWEFTRLTFAS